MASKRLRHAVGNIDPDRVVSAALEAALGEVGEPRKKRHPGRVLAAGAALATAAAVGQRRLPRMARLPLRMGLHKLGDMTHVEELADALHDRADALHHRLVGDDDEVDDADLADDEEFDEDAPPDDEGEEDFDDEDGDDVDDEDEDDFDDEDGEDFDDGPEDDDGPRDEGDDEEPEDEEDLDAEPEDEIPEDDLPEDEEPEEVDDEEDRQPDDDEEEDDEEVAARGLDLGVSSQRDAGPARDRVPELFEALRTRHRRAPVMRRGTARVDPATRPPEPGAGRHSDERRGSSRKSKPTARA